MEKEITLVIESLEKLAQQLELGVSQIWPWLVRQQYIAFIHSSICVVTLVFIGVKYINFIKKHWDPVDRELYDAERHPALWIALGWILAILFCIATISLFWDSAYILNPNYGALKSLMEMLNTCKGS